MLYFLVIAFICFLFVTLKLMSKRIDVNWKYLLRLTKKCLCKTVSRTRLELLELLENLRCDFIWYTCQDFDNMVFMFVKKNLHILHDEISGIFVLAWTLDYFLLSFSLSWDFYVIIMVVVIGSFFDSGSYSLPLNFFINSLQVHFPSDSQ